MSCVIVHRLPRFQDYTSDNKCEGDENPDLSNGLTGNALDTLPIRHTVGDRNSNSEQRQSDLPTLCNRTRQNRHLMSKDKWQFVR